MAQLYSLQSLLAERIVAPPPEKRNYQDSSSVSWYLGFSILSESRRFRAMDYGFAKAAPREVSP